jgi:CheY-like chemotaxis protein
MSDVRADEAWDTDRPPPAVLLVNDREAQRVAVRAMLAPLGLVVVDADSGRAALRAVLRQTVRLDPDGRADADDGRVRDSEAHQAAQSVEPDADHLHHRLQP